MRALIDWQQAYERHGDTLNTALKVSSLALIKSQYSRSTLLAIHPLPQLQM
jgi:hypothetical protein